MTITVVTLAHNRTQNQPLNEQIKKKFIIKEPVDIYPAETEYEKKK